MHVSPCIRELSLIHTVIPPSFQDEISYWLKQRNTRTKAEKMRHEMIVRIIDRLRYKIISVQETTLEERRNREEENKMIKAAEKDEPKISLRQRSTRDTEVAA